MPIIQYQPNQIHRLLLIILGFSIGNLFNFLLLAICLALGCSFSTFQHSQSACSFQTGMNELYQFPSIQSFYFCNLFFPCIFIALLLTDSTQAPSNMLLNWHSVLKLFFQSVGRMFNLFLYIYRLDNSSRFLRQVYPYLLAWSSKYHVLYLLLNLVKILLVYCGILRSVFLHIFLQFQQFQLILEILHQYNCLVSIDCRNYMSLLFILLNYLEEQANFFNFLYFSFSSSLEISLTFLICPIQIPNLFIQLFFI